MIIYKTTNLINGLIYVGVHNESKNHYIGSGSKLRKAIKEFGKENFKRVTLEQVNEETWRERESFWIEKLDARNPNIGYNKCVGGGDFPVIRGPEHWNYGKKWPQITKKKISSSLMNRKISLEHKNNISKGLKNSTKARKQIDGLHKLQNRLPKTRKHIKKITENQPTSKKVKINNVTYISEMSASKKLNITRQAVRWRLKSTSPKFVNYQYI